MSLGPKGTTSPCTCGRTGKWMPGLQGLSTPRWSHPCPQHPVALFQGAGGLRLHGDLQHGQRLPSGGAATEAGTGPWAAPPKDGGGQREHRAEHHLPSHLLQDHCFYQGHVEGHEHSAASLSTCAGLRWVGIAHPGRGGGCQHLSASALPHMPQGGKPRPRKAGLHMAAFLHTGVCPVRSHGSPKLRSSPRAVGAVPSVPLPWGGLCPRAPEGGLLSCKGLSSPDGHGVGGNVLIWNLLASFRPQGLFPGWLDCPPD